MEVSPLKKGVNGLTEVVPNYGCRLCSVDSSRLKTTVQGVEKIKESSQQFVQKENSTNCFHHDIMPWFLNDPEKRASK